ncbi:MAG: cation:proton antiporter [Solirubrobacterales bacterium]|nr:cation:proton antiporter [Solirubrobacterales bacterium]
MAKVDVGSFLAIVVAGTIAALIVSVVPRRYAPPVVVLELVFGIIIGPHVLGLAEVNDFITFFANLGLGMLFFFAGYEIDFDVVHGVPLKLAMWGWLISIALAYGIGGVLAEIGVVLSFLYTGSALATTAIGTLIPILHDEEQLHTRFGSYILAAGAIGEFGPILLLTLVLSTQDAANRALLLLAFIGLAIVIALISVRSAPAGWAALERTIEASGQLAVRLTALLVFGLAALAAHLGLDVVLGGFVAGMITRMAVRGREVSVLESKLTAVGFGLLIPFFFIVSGVGFNVSALFASVGAILKVPMFLALFLIVRGLPALVLYRNCLPGRDRLALAFYSATALPLVVAITEVAIQDGHMRSSTASALVGAAILSTLIFPFVARVLRREAKVEPFPQAEVEAPPVASV